MKKRIISLLLVVSMVLSLLPVSALAAGTKDTAADSPFTDVKPGDWCYDAVLYAKANGLFQRHQRDHVQSQRHYDPWDVRHGAGPYGGH